MAILPQHVTPRHSYSVHQQRGELLLEDVSAMPLKPGMVVSAPHGLLPADNFSANRGRRR